jgi:MFS family permease
LPVQATLLAVSTLVVLSSSAIAPSLPAIRTHFAGVAHADYWVKMLLAVPALFIMVGGTIAGQMIDRFGRKRLLITTVIIFSLAGGSGFILNSLSQILVGRALLGLAVATVGTCATTLIADYYTQETRSFLMGLQSTIISLSGVLVLSLSGFLADFNWRAPFLLHLLPLFLVPFLILFLHEPKPHLEFGVRSSEFGVELNSELGILNLTNPELHLHSVSVRAASPKERRETLNSVDGASPQEKPQTPNSKLRILNLTNSVGEASPQEKPQTPNPELRSCSVSIGETPNPEPRTPNSKPQTPNPEPRTPSPELQTPNPEPRTPNPELQTLCLIYTTEFLHMLLFMITPVELPFYLTGVLGFTSAFGGFAIATLVFAQAIVAFNYSKVQPRLGFGGTLGVAFGLAGLGYGVVAIAPGYPGIVAGLMISGFGFGLLFPNAKVWLSETVSSSFRGRVLGGLVTAVCLGEFLSPFMSQVLVNALGYRGLYGCGSAFLGTIALVTLIKIRFPIAQQI